MWGVIAVAILVCLGLQGQTSTPPAAPGNTPDRAARTSSEPSQSHEKPVEGIQAPPKAAETALAIVLEGRVKSGNAPIPGATVTATNTATGQKVVGWTQPDGSYKLALPAAGDYSVRVQMVAFAAATQQARIGAGSTHHQLDFHITLLSRTENTGGAYARAGAGFQALSVTAGEGGNNASGGEGNESVAPSGMPVPGIPPSVSTESVAVSGSSSSANMFGMSTDELRNRLQDYRNQQGGLAGPGGPGGPGGGFGPGGGGGGGFGGPRGGGGTVVRGRFNFNKPHGMFYYS